MPILRPAHLKTIEEMYGLLNTGKKTSTASWRLVGQRKKTQIANAQVILFSLSFSCYSTWPALKCLHNWQKEAWLETNWKSKLNFTRLFRKWNRSMSCRTGEVQTRSYSFLPVHLAVIDIFTDYFNSKGVMLVWMLSLLNIRPCCSQEYEVISRGQKSLTIPISAQGLTIIIDSIFD